MGGTGEVASFLEEVVGRGTSSADGCICAIAGQAGVEAWTANAQIGHVGGTANIGTGVVGQKEEARGTAGASSDRAQTGPTGRGTFHTVVPYDNCVAHAGSHALVQSRIEVIGRLATTAVRGCVTFQAGRHTWLALVEFINIVGTGTRRKTLVSREVFIGGRRGTGSAS